jgi:hypothetical protein
VRFLCAAACAADLSDAGHTPPNPNLAVLAEYLLVTAWKADLRFRWRALASDTRFGMN